MYFVCAVTCLREIVSISFEPGWLSRYSAGLGAGWSGVRVPTGGGNLCLHHRVQTGFEAHPASYKIGVRGSLRGTIHPFPQYAFKAWCSAQGQLYLHLNSIYFLFVIALGFVLGDCGSRVRFPAGARDFSLHHRVQNGSWAHPAFCPMGTRVSFPGDKAAGA
jgi:hypothetical protein